MKHFQKAGPPVEWGKPMGASGGQSTWRRIFPHPDKPKAFKEDIAFCTCPNGHEQTLSGKVHTVDTDGRVMPSYVCPRDGCGFHDHIVLDGWTP
jgi:hypothetical protein